MKKVDGIDWRARGHIELAIFRKGETIALLARGAGNGVYAILVEGTPKRWNLDEETFLGIVSELEGDGFVPSPFPEWKLN
jgi:hypothetical protein